jgi:hypothetical protein
VLARRSYATGRRLHTRPAGWLTTTRQGGPPAAAVDLSHLIATGGCSRADCCPARVDWVR